MAVKKPHFAVDLAPMGINLWQRGRTGDWLGLGFVPSKAGNFSQSIEDLRLNAKPPGGNSAEIRIPKSDVYFTRIRAAEIPGKPTDQAILARLSDRIPFRDRSAPMVVDTRLRGSGDLAVAVVPVAVLREAADFATRHGFVPDYFTTLNNPLNFPSPPVFRLPGKPQSRPTGPAGKRAWRLPLAAAVAVLGLVSVGWALFAPADGAFTTDADALQQIAAASPDLRQDPLDLPGTIATGQPGPTPGFAAEVAAPAALSNPPLLVASVPDRAAPVPAAQPRRDRQAAGFLAGTGDSTEFEPSGMTTRTRRLLDNSFITIEEPADGQTGRKTIRILPSDPGRGSRNQRFDPAAYVRVAQVQTANDATSGLPDVDNPLLRVNDDGIPVFKGPPGAVPPPRPDTGLKAFSDGIARVLDAPDAADVASVRIQKPSLGTIRPRPNPRREQQTATPAATPPAAQPDTGAPVNRPTAGTLRPKPRPDSLAGKVQKRDIETAAALAEKEAIRESMPTVNAVFVSLFPKSRPDDMTRLIERTKPDLTSGRSGSKAVVRSAPSGARTNSGTMTTAKTPKSVAALATESARIDKHSLSLIGIFGTNSARRALLRLPSGRYLKVKQGDDVGGWTVSAIGESAVRIKRGSRDEVLRMPE